MDLGSLAGGRGAGHLRDDRPADATLGGTVGGAPEGAGLGLLLYPYSGTASSTPLHEEPVVGDAWSLRLRGPPLADPLDDGYAYAAIELRMAYVDRGPSGFDRGDAAQRRFAVAPRGPTYMPGSTRMDSNATSTLMGPCRRPPRCVFGDPQGGRGRAGRPSHRPLRASA